MNNLLLMGSALYKYIDNNSTVDIYYRIAPQNKQPPFCIISLVTSADDYTFGSNGINAEYLVKVVGNKTFPEATISTYGEIHDLIQDAPLSISGNVLLKFRRNTTVEYQDPEDFWNVGGIYNYETWKT